MLSLVSCDNIATKEDNFWETDEQRERREMKKGKKRKE